MHKAKFRIFNSGLTDEEKDLIAKQEEVKAKFKAEQDKVKYTIKTDGFKVILDKIVGDIESTKYKLLTCKEKDLARLQLEVQVRREFLEKWTPYQD